MLPMEEGESTRPSIDLNGITTNASKSQHVGSGGGGQSIVGPSRIRTTVTSEGSIPSALNASMPQTLTWLLGSMSFLPEHLHTEFLEWYRAKCGMLENGGFLTPWPKQHIGQQLQRYELPIRHLELTAYFFL